MVSSRLVSSRLVHSICTLVFLASGCIDESANDEQIVRAESLLTEAQFTPPAAGESPRFVRHIFRRAQKQQSSGRWVLESEEMDGWLEGEYSPMGIPMAALSNQLDRRLVFGVQVSKSAEDTAPVREEFIDDWGNRPLASGTSPQIVFRGRSLRDALATRDEFARTDEGEYIAYLTFHGDIALEPAGEIDWTAADSRTPKERLLATNTLRRDDVDAFLGPLLAEVEAQSGCRLLSSTSPSSAAYFACDDASVIKLDELDYLRSAMLVTVPEVQAGMAGDSFRSATGSQSQLFLSNGYSGESSASGPIKVALIDPQGFYHAWLHPAFDDTLNGPSRIVAREKCNTATCWHSFGDLGFFGDHGTSSMLGAFAHLLQGQDLNLTTQTQREERTYGSYEAQLILIQHDGSAALAIRRAVDLGADIIVLSEVAGRCGEPSSVQDVSDAWDYAYSMGAYGIISAGNHTAKYNDDCHFNGYATRPDILVVGGFGDQMVNWYFGLPPSPVQSWEYDSESLMGWHFTDLSGLDNCPTTTWQDPDECWSTALGGAYLRYANGAVLRSRNTIDMVGPSRREWTPKIDVNNVVSYTETGSGTSVSAPGAASDVVSLLDWARANNLSEFSDPAVLNVVTMLWGDGTQGSYTSFTNTGNVSRLDRLWGAGRLKARQFDDAGLDGPWGWGTIWSYVWQGNVWDIPVGTGPISSDVDYLRASMFWQESNLDAADATRAAANIIMSLVTTNPQSGVCTNPYGGNATTVLSDSSYDVQKQLLMRDVSAVRGKCAWIRIRAYSVPIGPDNIARRKLHVAYMYEDRDREPYENLAGID